MKMEKRKLFISIYRHPKDKIINIELGKIDASEMIYRRDEKKKDFIEIGYPQLLEIIRLPKPMNKYECNKWIKTQKDIMKSIHEYKNIEGRE